MSQCIETIETSKTRWASSDCWTSRSIIFISWRKRIELYFQPSKTNESEDEEVDNEENDCGSDSDMYEDIKPSTKRKSSDTHQKDSKRSWIESINSFFMFVFFTYFWIKRKNLVILMIMKSKRSHPNQNVVHKSLLNPKMVEPTKTHDIKSMFTATKARNVQKQEQVLLSECFLFGRKILFL